MPSQLSGSDYFRTIPPVFYKTFRDQDLLPRVGNGAMSLLKHDATTATVRTATKKAIVLNGSSQYASKASPSNCDMNGAELCANGTFESDLSGWTALGGSSAARITTDFHSGVACAEITQAGSGSNYAFRYDSGTMTAGTKYTLEFWAKSISGNANLSCGNVTDSQTQVITGAWVKYVFNFVATVGSAFRFYLGGVGVFLLDDVSFTPAYDFTIMAWAKTSVLGAQFILNKWNNSVSAGWELSESSSGYLTGKVRDDATSVDPTDTTLLNDGTWVFAALSVDRDGMATLYRNGVAVGTPLSAATVGKIATTYNFVVGARVTVSPWNGSIGEVQVVRGYALTAEDVLNVYNYGIPDSYFAGTVVAHYKWDGNVGTDESSSDNDLTLTGSPTFETGTYTQYATYNSDGSIRLWGNYLSYSNIPTYLSNFSVLYTVKPLFAYTHSVNLVMLALLSNSSAGIEYFRYTAASDNIQPVIGSVSTAVSNGAAYTSNAELNTKQRFLLSCDFANDLYTLYKNREVYATSASVLTASTLSGVLRIGYPTYFAPYDVYAVAIFPAALTYQQMINIDSAYQYAL